MMCTNYYDLDNMIIFAPKFASENGKVKPLLVLVVCTDTSSVCGV